MKINEYLKEYPEYLKGPRDATDNTVADYMHDVNRYLDYFREKVDPSLESFEINASHIRGFVTFLRIAQNENSTIERRLHGLYSFWTFLHDDHNFSAPISIRACHIRLKKRRNPTQPLMQKNYTLFMERLQDELTKIK
jgi:site-specific recombinase XerD